MDSLNLTYFDYLILAIMAYSIIAAFYKGLIKACTSFFGWIISVMGSYMLFTPVEAVISKIVTNNMGSTCISLFLGFVLSIIFTSMITNKILDLTPNIRGGIIDRSLGFAFGFVRGLIVSCIIFQIIVLASPLFLTASEDPLTGITDFPLPEMVKKAKTYQLLNQGSGLLISFVPKDLVQKEIDMLAGKIAANALSNKKTDNKTSDALPDDKKSNGDAGAIDTDSLIKSLTNIKSEAASSGSNALDVPAPASANTDTAGGANANSIDITDVIKKINELAK